VATLPERARTEELGRRAEQTANVRSRTDPAGRHI
jgi:hypothetical protein